MERLIEIARAEVGYLEKASNNNLYSKTENAGHGNYTKYAHEMSKYHAGIFANGFAWCDTFVDWCMVRAYGPDKAKELIYGWSAYTPTSAGYFKNMGRWHTEPQKGDIIFFKDKYGTICHTGIVYGVDMNYVYTVEGNTSYQSGVVANGGAVAQKMYKIGYAYIAGYGRPDYSIVKKEPAGDEESVKEEIIKEDDTMYKTIEDCPKWAQPYVKLGVEKGYIKGDTSGNLGLDDTRIWCLVVMLRISEIMD